MDYKLIEGDFYLKYFLICYYLAFKVNACIVDAIIITNHASHKLKAFFGNKFSHKIEMDSEFNSAEWSRIYQTAVW